MYTNTGNVKSKMFKISKIQLFIKVLNSSGKMLPNVDSDETVTGAVDATVCGEVSVTAAVDADVCCSTIFTMRFIYHTHFSLFKLHIILFI